MRLAFFGIVLLGLSGCGYVGDPLPPALNIPKPVLDLRAIERGDKLEVTFTMPALTGENLPVTKPGRLDLRVGVAPPPPFDLNAWLSGTQEIFVEWPAIAAPPAPAPTVTQTFDARPWAGKEVIIGVRASSPSGRLGVMSNLVALSVVPPLAPPANFKGESRADGILLQWTPSSQPGVAYRVTRQMPEGQPETIADVREPQHLDLLQNFGPTYRYTVQSYVRGGDINALSEVSTPLAVVHTDHFPPATPTGLVALAGAKTIELGWDRNTDPDLAGYRLYRSANGGAFERVPGDLTAPAYRDERVQTGQRYRYAVSAVDRLGNESPRSEPAEAEAP